MKENEKAFHRDQSFALKYFTLHENIIVGTCRFEKHWNQIQSYSQGRS